MGHQMSIEKEFWDLSNEEARQADGTGNNLTYDTWGSAGETTLRVTFADYEDGVWVPEDRGNAREISNAMADIPGGTPNSYGTSQLFIFFGQFLDHDLDLLGEDPAAGKMTTVVPEDDPVFPAGAHLELERSAYVDGTGNNTTPREHENLITSFIDASNVYGSSQATTEALRDGAYLITSGHGGVPQVADILSVHPDADLNGLFIGNPTYAHVVGDVRGDENIALTSMHEIWLREHNYQVDWLKSLDLGLSDEKLFHTARMIVEAEIQKVVYDEWLPELLGTKLPTYGGYDPNVNPTISNEFAGAAFRFGHSLLPTEFERLNEEGWETQKLGLFDTFFQPHKLDEAGGVTSLVRGLAANVTSEYDAKIIDDVRNLLFGGGEELAFRDLAVLNIMRGRDQGIPTLNEVREEIGYKAYESFNGLTGGDKALAQGLFEAYGGDIDAVDLWVGLLAEKNVDGGQVGETLQAILVDQFTRLRDGDRFYYEERLADYPEVYHKIETSSFSEVISRTLGIEYLQKDVFKAYERIVGDDTDNTLYGGDGRDLIVGYDGKDTIYGGYGDDEIYGGYGADVIYGGYGVNFLNGEYGDDILWAGHDKNIFIFDYNSGHDEVRHFSAKEDYLDLSSWGFKDWSEISERAYQDGNNTVIQLDDAYKDSITLVDVTWNHLTPYNFVLDKKDGYDGLDGRYFDSASYLSANSDVYADGIHPYDHYINYGWKEGRNPSAYFDTDRYLSDNPGVKEAGVNPLEHYLEHGKAEGREAPVVIGDYIQQNGFDAEYYLLSNPGVGLAGMDAWEHYSLYGWKENRDPNAYFDTDGYLETYTDVKEDGINPLAHYNLFGWSEGRDPSKHFDTDAYLEANPGVYEAGLDPLKHFLDYGHNEGREAYNDGIWG